MTDAPKNIYIHSVYTEKSEFNWIMPNSKNISAWPSYYIVSVDIYVLNMINIYIYIDMWCTFYAQQFFIIKKRKKCYSRQNNAYMEEKKIWAIIDKIVIY